MALRIDLHVHTQLHSSCSHIEPEQLIPQALEAGLDGLVITEHAYQWREDDLARLLAQSGQPDFLLLAGFEYSSTCGDVLIYGLDWQQVRDFPRGLSPEDAVKRARGLGASCIGAHPTRQGMGFDQRILALPLDGIEVRSVNLKENEQRTASELARKAKVPAIAASDAHRIDDVGRYATEFYGFVKSMEDLQEALRHGRFIAELNGRTHTE